MVANDSNHGPDDREQTRMNTDLPKGESRFMGVGLTENFGDRKMGNGQSQIANSRLRLRLRSRLRERLRLGIRNRAVGGAGHAPGDDFAALGVFEGDDELDVVEFDGVHELEEVFGVLEIEGVVRVGGPDVGATEVKLVFGVLQQHSFHSDPHRLVLHLK